MKRDWGPSAPLNLRYAKNSKEQIVELLKKACALMRCHRFASDIFPLVAPVVCLPCEVDPAPPTVSEDAMCLQRLRHPHILSVIEATGLFGLYRSDKLSVHLPMWAYKPILRLVRRSKKYMTCGKMRPWSRRGAHWHLPPNQWLVGKPKSCHHPMVSMLLGQGSCLGDPDVFHGFLNK